MKVRHFIILVGGPGLYDGDDPAHDKAWYNYIDPVMAAAKSGQLSRPDEQVHWYIYGPAYERRWADDITEPSFIDRYIQDGDLNVTRYGHTRKVVAEGASDYLDYIKKKAARYAKPGSKKINVITNWWGASSLFAADKFWTALGSFPDQSISRVWFLGHAAGDLWLSLRHEGDDAVSPVMGEIVERTGISRHGALAKKLAFANAPIVANQTPSKFYGCNTMEFARL
ncbi:hypothetical protein ACN28S_65800 [Cystobacter fuscus]